MSLVLDMLSCKKGGSTLTSSENPFGFLTLRPRQSSPHHCNTSSLLLMATLLMNAWRQLNSVMITTSSFTAYLPILSEYACRLRLIVSQTQVDFKAGEYINPAYITYIHDRVLRRLYKKPKHRKSWK